MPINPAQVQWDSKAIDPSAVQWDDEPSFGDQLKRQLGLTARYAIEGPAQFAGIFTDPLAYGLSAATGEQAEPLYQMASRFATRLGLPEPETNLEQIVAQGSRGITSAVPLLGAAQQVATRAPGLTASIAQTVSQNPGAQLASAASGGAAQEKARQEGATTSGQVVANVLGSIAPAAGIPLLRAATSPYQAVAASDIRRDVPDIDTLLANQAPSRTPGVTRTVLEETLSPDVANLERRVTAGGSTAIPRQQQTNTAARIAQLQRIAGTQDDLAAAEAARNAAAGPLHREAMRVTNVNVNKAVSEVNKAIARLEGTPPIQNALKEVRRLLVNANRPARTGPLLIPEGGGASMQELDNIRKTIGLMIEGKFPGEGGADLRGARELIGARDALDTILAARVPEYRQYLDTYRGLSAPVNQLQVSQEILSRSVQGAADDDGASRLLTSPFIRATEGLGDRRRSSPVNRLAQTATGFNRAMAENILSPQDQATIQAIRADLVRKNLAQEARALTAGNGSPTALTQNLTAEARSAIGRVLDGLPILQSVSAGARARLNDAVAEALANPERARALLARFPRSEQQAARTAMIAVGVSLEPQQAQ